MKIESNLGDFPILDSNFSKKDQVYSIHIAYWHTYNNHIIWVILYMYLQFIHSSTKTICTSSIFTQDTSNSSEFLTSRNESLFMNLKIVIEWSKTTEKLQQVPGLCNTWVFCCLCQPQSYGQLASWCLIRDLWILPYPCPARRISKKINEFVETCIYHVANSIWDNHDINWLHMLQTAYTRTHGESSIQWDVYSNKIGNSILGSVCTAQYINISLG